MYADLDSIGEARRGAERAYDAWVRFRAFEPEQIDRIVAAMASAVAPEARRLAELAWEESGYGNVDDKILKNLYNSITVADWLRRVKTLGVLWHDEVTHVAAIGEPMGVVAALIPVTHPTALVIFKVLSAVKAGNAIVCAPHPRGARASAATAAVLADAAMDAGAPPDLVQCLSMASIEASTALMRHPRTSVVLATGGAGMVRAAYSSGKPTLAVGPGNVPCYVDRTMRDDLAEVADGILTSKSFDYGTGCVCEQALVVDRPVDAAFRSALRAAGAYFCSPSEADRIARVVFDPGGGIVADNVAQAAPVLAERAGFGVPPRTRALVVEPDGVGPHAPLSAEKLSPVLAYYVAEDAVAGYRLAAQVLAFGGVGHTAAVHARDPEVVARFSALPAGRVFVNVPCMHAGIGFSADVEPSFMLGTGTLSGSITSDNVTALHLINIKRVAYESRPWRSLPDLFARIP